MAGGRRSCFLKIVDFNSFRFSVVVMFGDLNGIRGKYYREVRRLKVRDPYPFSDVRALVEDSLAVDTAGVTCGFSETGGDVFVYLRDWSLPGFVHEAHHAVHRGLGCRGVDDEEAFAYHLEHLVGEVVRAVETVRPQRRRGR